MPKKQALFPIEYDEVSLVDNGASQEADVLIFKREISKYRVLPGGEATSQYSPPKKSVATAPKKTSSTSTSTSTPSRPKKKAKKKAPTRSQKNPCATGTNSTGAKGKGKQTPRAKNWNPNKHPRKQNGQMATTSAQSKAKNGKGGTTKAKLDAKCRAKKGGKAAKVSSGSSFLKKNFTMNNWEADALVRSTMERKAIS